MLKSDLINRLADRLGLSIKDVGISVGLILGEIAKGLASQRRTEIRGFGSFGTHKVAARAARNPMTGAPVSVPEKSRIHFKPGKALAVLQQAGSNSRKPPDAHSG